MTKRTFFKSLMGAVAAVALAPEIAFGVRLEMPVIPVEGIIVMEWSDGSIFQMTRDNVFQLSKPEFEAGLFNTASKINALAQLDGCGPLKFQTVKMQPYSKFQEMRRKSGLTK